MEFVINPDLRRGIRVKGKLTLKGVHHLEEAYLSLRREMEVMFSVPCEVVLTVESSYRALMPASDAERTGTW